MLPKLKTDPNYLQDPNMSIHNTSGKLDPLSIDFSEYSEKHFPYTIVQDPGPRNALGRYKFIFPNKYAIYLHDTPSKSFFNLDERAFSHGCVRVQNPQILIERLIGEQGYDQDKINEIVASNVTKNVFLKQSLQVMLMYWTCYEFEGSDRLHFNQDIYGRDKNILKQLKSSR